MPGAEKLRPAHLAGVVVAVFVLGLLPSVGQALVESHAHRQTQTAYTALLYAEHGVNLLRPPLPILGPPGSLPQELPLFQAVGALLIRAGIGADVAMRLTGLISAVAAALATYFLARRLVSPAAATVVLAAFLINPIAWMYGRASLIEYPAVAASIGFLYFASRWMDEGRATHWAAAAVAGLVGIGVKITTGGFLVLPALLWRSPSGRWGFQRLSVWLLVVGIVALGLAWSLYAQSVREETPASQFLSMRNQVAWFFGEPWQRFDPAAWRVPLVAILALTGFGALAWAPMGVAAARAGTQRWFLLALLGLSALMPLLLFNLYAIHDYYWIAVSPMVAIAVGLGTDWLRARWRRRWVRRLGIGLAGAWVATIAGMAPSWTVIYRTPPDEARTMAMADFIREHSSADDWVVQTGWGWDPTFLYYARRQGIAVPGSDPTEGMPGFGRQDLSDIDFERILADPVLGPFIDCDKSGRCALAEQPS